MSKVYLVTSGSYSDYAVRAVFSTNALAEAFIEACQGKICSEFNNVEEFDLDPQGEAIRGKYRPFRVEMNIDGNNANAVEMDEDFCGDYCGALVPRGSYWWRRGYNYPPPDRFRGNVLARDKNHAIKILNEKRTQWIAEHPEAFTKLQPASSPLLSPSAPPAPPPTPASEHPG